MSKKDKGKKYDTEGQTLTSADVAKVPAEVVNGDTPAKVAKPTSHLVLDTKDVNGRDAYRFARCTDMPKKAPRIPITLDGKPAEMAVTSSGGYSALVGYNGYLQDKDGHNGWILFGDNVNPNDKEQFPNGLNFTTTQGLCAANPVRQPKNPDGEANRRAMAKVAAEKRAAEKAAATTEQTTAEGETAAS